MKRFIFTLIGVWMASMLATYAQDDIYFTPKKKKAKKEVVENSADEDERYERRETVMDVDTYNRRNRNQYAESEESEYYEEENEAEGGVYTSRTPQIKNI